MADHLPMIWPLESHTLAKHMILQNYLRAWLPIMGSSNRRLLFIDGYAGPGVYNNGEDGSPVIVVKEAMDYISTCATKGWTKPEIVCLFIEQDAARFASLTETLGKIEIPSQIKVNPIHSSFEETASKILSFLDAKSFSLAPAFIFVDPFGYNLPFSLITRLMNYPKCEVFINLMYAFVNRFINRSGQEEVMTRLFGGEEWRGLDLKDNSPSDRWLQIHDLYQRQLQKHAAKYVRSFTMRDARNVPLYFLFYGTNHKIGLEKMKTAMWRVDKGGSYAFSDATDPSQLVFFGNGPDYKKLKSLIVEKFSGRAATIEEIEDFVLCETPFLPTQFKREILKPMETNQELYVLTSSRKRKGTFPSDTVLQFAEV